VSLDRTLYVLAVLCAGFAAVTRLGDRHFARDTDSRSPA
jgi:hypothetical protein